MNYTSNHLFHYTKFDSAIGIIQSHNLRFGLFENMNDIAEVRREVYGMIPIDKILLNLGNYKSISMTNDFECRRSFTIDPLWVYYAEKGNEVCLVFDKGKIKVNLKKQFNSRAIIKPIKYLSNYSNEIFTEGESTEDVRIYIEKHINDIFFTKSIDWKFIQEYRILLMPDNSSKVFYYGEDALIAAILCLPKIEKYKESEEFLKLRKVFKDRPILHYTTDLGNKMLIDENDEPKYNVIGKDIHLAL